MTSRMRYGRGAWRAGPDGPDSKSQVIERLTQACMSARPSAALGACLPHAALGLCTFMAAMVGAAGAAPLYSGAAAGSSTVFRRVGSSGFGLFGIGGRDVRASSALAYDGGAALLARTSHDGAAAPPALTRFGGTTACRLPCACGIGCGHGALADGGRAPSALGLLGGAALALADCGGAHRALALLGGAALALADCGGAPRALALRVAVGIRRGGRRRRVRVAAIVARRRRQARRSSRQQRSVFGGAGNRGRAACNSTLSWRKCRTLQRATQIWPTV